MKIEKKLTQADKLKDEIYRASILRSDLLSKTNDEKNTKKLRIDPVAHEKKLNVIDAKKKRRAIEPNLADNLWNGTATLEPTYFIPVKINGPPGMRTSIMKTLIFQKMGITPGVYGGLRFDNISKEWRMLMSEKVLNLNPNLLTTRVLTRISTEELLGAKEEHIKELTTITLACSIMNTALKDRLLLYLKHYKLIIQKRLECC
jgi:hypothetical protein